MPSSSSEESNLIPSGHGTRLLSVLEGQSSIIPEGRRAQENLQIYPHDNNGIRFAQSYQSQDDPNDAGLHS